MKKRFIEYDLPLAEISEQSAREKNIRHGHPSTLHIWWARRPLASSRATALAALLDDPGPHDPKKRREIRELIEQITPWEAVKNGNSAAIKKAQKLIREQYGDTPPKVLDPFSGGGSIPLEALRLGCETYASDYNPVAVFIEKATLEWPQKFGIQVKLPKNVDDAGLGMGGKKVNLLAYLVEKWANLVQQNVRAELKEFYPEEKGVGLVGKRAVVNAEGWVPAVYVWVRTVPCQNPSCGAIIPLYRQSWLANKSGKKIAYRTVVQPGSKQVEFELLDGVALDRAMGEGFDPNVGTVSRANVSCPVCGQVTKAGQVRKLGREGRMGNKIVAVALQHGKEAGKKYRLAKQDDDLFFRRAEGSLKGKLQQWSEVGIFLSSERIPLMSGTFNAPIYGIDTYDKLYNSRQKLALLTFASEIKVNREKIRDECEHILGSANMGDIDSDDLANAVVGVLALILDQVTLKNNSLARWNNLAEKTEYFISNNAVPMMWDYAEVNPIADTAGA